MGISCMVLSVILVLTMILATGIGPVSIPFKTVWKIVWNRVTGMGDVSDIKLSTQNIVWHLRVPRVLMGAMVGASLTLSGVAMQSFTKNPLASPYVLGISSGATFGATLAIVTGSLFFLGSYAVEGGAFLGAMAAILIVYYMAKSGKEVAPIKLVLVGTAIAAMFTAFSNFIVYKAPDDSKIREVTFWTLGSVASSKWEELIPVVVILVPGFICMFAMSDAMNALLMGESSAVTLGVNVNLVRKVTVFLSAALTGVTVAVTGSIGFVGLVIPHIVRSMVGADHKKVIPISTLIGAIFLVWVDVGARCARGNSHRNHYLYDRCTDFPVDDPCAQVCVWKEGVRKMLKVENITYKTRQTEILKGVSLQVKQGEFVGVIGPNGSGKSTLLKNIYRMLTPTSGEILLDGKSLIKMSNRKMAERLAVVSQENEANFDFTVGEVVQMGRYPRKKMMEAANERDREIVGRSLEMVGMEEFQERSFLTLSGGEKQRVLIARALAQETEMIILDEPTNHLDIGSQLKTLSLLKSSGKTVLTALHDLSLAARFCDRIYVLKDGKNLCDGTPETLISSELVKELYQIEAEVFLHKDRIYIDYQTEN